MRLTDEAQGAVEFGRFRLLPHRRELHADGAVVELGGRAFEGVTRDQCVNWGCLGKFGGVDW